jgi:ribonuclease R
LKQKAKTMTKKNRAGNRFASGPAKDSSGGFKSPSGFNRGKARQYEEFSPRDARGPRQYDTVIPERVAIAALIEQQPGIGIAKIARVLNVERNAVDGLTRRVDAMLRDGELTLKSSGQLYVGKPRELQTGKLFRHRDGYGFITPDEGGGDDLYVASHNLAGAMHGDTVAYAERGQDKRGRTEAKIVEVRERAIKQIVGRLKKDGARWLVVPREKNFSDPVVLDRGTKGNEGDFVTALITRYPENGRPMEGKVTEVLGGGDDSGIEIEVALRKHDLPHVFSKAAENEAEKLPTTLREQDYKDRRDVRDLPLVTIDGEDARDFDDAVFCAPQGRGFRLVVAIADVSHYVRPGAPLDVDARERATSVYFPRRVIPMLPEKLSNGLCSLNPNVDRLVMVCDMGINEEGEIARYEFYPGVMHSQARFTYTEVAEILDNPQGEAAQKRKALVPHLASLYKVFQALLGARARRGAIDFESTETKMVFNEAGRIERIVPVVRNEAHKLIEECMLAANVCAAEYLDKFKHPALFRVHAGPTPEKLENLRAFLGPLSLSIGGGDNPQAKDYAKLSQEIKGRPDAALISSVMLRSMQQAVYAPDNVGHFGLSYEMYAHFTSPIRRYPDLLVHRSIKAVLKRRQYQEDDWDALGVHCSRLERRADDASREVQSWLKCHYAAEHLGDEFDGTISGVAGFGIFVTLDPLMIDGMVHISELGRDYFTFDEVHHLLRGERSGKEFRFGQRVRVKLVRADADSLKIDLALVDKPPAEKPAVFAPSLDVATHAEETLLPKRPAQPVPVTAAPEPAQPAPAAKAKRAKLAPAPAPQPVVQAPTSSAPKSAKKTPAAPAKEVKAPAKKAATQTEAKPTKVPAKSVAKTPAKAAKAAKKAVPASQPAKPAKKAAKQAPKKAANKAPQKAAKKAAPAKAPVAKRPVAVKSAPVKKAAGKKAPAKAAGKRAAKK